MKTEFIPSTESLSSEQRELIEHAANIEEAKSIAPWACEIVEREGGWMAYESATDAEIAENQL